MPSSRSRLAALDLSLTVLGAAVPLSLFAYHLVKDRPQGKRFFRGAFATPFSTALTLDLTLSTFAFLRLAQREIQARRAPGPFWLYACLNTFVGLSPAFPLLLWRSRSAASEGLAQGSSPGSTERA